MSKLCPWDPPRGWDTDLRNFWRGGRLEFSTSHHNFVSTQKNYVQKFDSKLKFITEDRRLEFSTCHHNSSWFQTILVFVLCTKNCTKVPIFLVIWRRKNNYFPVSQNNFSFCVKKCTKVPIFQVICLKKTTISLFLGTILVFLLCTDQKAA